MNLVAIFIALGLLSGLAFAVLNPPLQAFDETQHYERIYQLSTGDLFSDRVRVRTPDGQLQSGYGGKLPEHLVKVIERTAAANNPEKSTYRFGVVRRLWEKPPSGDRPVSMRFDNTAMYGPVAYAPEVGGTWLARVVGLPDIGQVYAARIAELLCWLLLMAAAIRITPVGREIFFVLAVNPLAIWQATTLSPDAMGAGLLALSVAILLRIRTPQPGPPQVFSPAMKVVFATAVLAACTIKVSYIPVAALLLLVPNDLWRRTWRWVVAAGVVVVAAAWQLAVLPAAAGIPEFHNLTEGVVDSHQQVTYIVHHLPRFLGIVLWNVFGANSIFWGDDYVSHLSWTTLPRWVPYLWLALLVYAVTLRRPEPATETWRRAKGAALGMVAIAVVSAFMVVGALYVGWTYIGSDVIMGIQRRYWIPLTFLAIPTFLTVRPYFEGSRRNAVLTLGALAMLLAGVITVFLDYQGYTV